MKKRIELMNTYFDARIAECFEREKRLCQDERRDEADFEKVRANIYGVFKTVLSAAQKTCGDDDSAVKEFFLKKLEQIPENWRTSYEKAYTHGDAEKLQIESLKLGTAEEIKTKFKEIWESEQ